MPKHILSRPIFKLGVDKRTESYNEKWFDEVLLPTFHSEKAQGYLPVAHIGHNDGVTEKPRVAFMDNIRRIGNQVFSDLLDIPDLVAPAIAENLFPNCSVEIRADGKGFGSLALLGSSEPHFKLAQQNQLVEGHFKALPAQNGTPTIITFEAAEMSLTDAIELQDKQSEVWRIDDALQSKMWDIKNSETMTAEEKKAAIDEVLQEYLGIKAAAEKEIVDITDGSGTAADDAQFAARVASAEDALNKKFAAREAELLDRENKLLEADLSASGLAIPVINNFLALRKHLSNETKSVQFKAGDTTQDITPRTAFEEYMKDLAKRFKAGTLFAVTEPVKGAEIVSPDRAADAQVTDEQKEVAAIEKYMAENNIKNFADARRAYLQFKAAK